MVAVLKYPELRLSSEGRTFEFVSLSIELEDFGSFLQLGLINDPETLAIEQCAQRLIQSDFNPQQTNEFICTVCGWGGYAGIAGRVIKNNDPLRIVSALRDAYAATQYGKIDVAMEHMLALKDLGVSFSSKHLKFLDPNRHVVLDSVISGRLGYPLTTDGYCRFVEVCQKILGHLSYRNIQTTSLNHQSWRLADVEMAIYQWLRKKTHEQSKQRRTAKLPTPTPEAGRSFAEGLLGPGRRDFRADG